MVYKCCSCHHNQSKSHKAKGLCLCDRLLILALLLQCVSSAEITLLFKNNPGYL